MTTGVEPENDLLPFDRARSGPVVPEANAPEAAAPDEPRFRFPGADDPAPGTRRLLVMSLYAAVLGLAGVGIGIRGLVSVIGGGVPWWYVPLLAFLGLLSVAMVVGAFLSVHRPRTPKLLLGAAAAPLTAAVLLAVAY